MQCDNCGTPLKFTQQNPPYPDYGLQINLTGHYGGFNDSIFNGGTVVTLCHDCCVLVFKAIPGATNHLLANVETGGGLHPYDFYEGPCCEYGWTIKP